MVRERPKEMTILDSTYACNHCGREMKHRDAKVGLWEWDGEKSIRLDIHICEDCKHDVIAYANGEAHTCPVEDKNVFLHGAAANTSRDIVRLMTREEKDRAGMTVGHAPVAKPKKKHEFYGNQYILPNRKSRK